MVVKGAVLGKVAETAKEDLAARKDNWKDTLREIKTRISLKEVGTPIMFSDDTILGKHFKKAREITARAFGRR